MPDTSFDGWEQDIYDRRGPLECPGPVGPCSADGRGGSATLGATCHIWVTVQKDAGVPSPLCVSTRTRQPTLTLQAGMYEPASHVRCVFNSLPFVILVFFFFKKRPFSQPSWEAHEFLSKRRWSSDSASVSAWEGVTPHLGWVGAWPRDLATHAVEWILTLGLLRGRPSASSCLLESHSELFNMHSPPQG